MKISAIRTIFLVVSLFTGTTMLDAMKRSQQALHDDSSDKQDNKKQKISPKKTLPSVCPTCNRCFSAPRYLTQHQNKTHSKNSSIEPKTANPFPCTMCQQNFTSIQRLENHKVSIHLIYLGNIQETKQNVPITTTFTNYTVSKDRPHGCPQCKETFTTEGFLSSHMHKSHNPNKVLKKDVPKNIFSHSFANVAIPTVSNDNRISELNPFDPLPNFDDAWF